MTHVPAILELAVCVEFLSILDVAWLGSYHTNITLLPTAFYKAWGHNTDQVSAEEVDHHPEIPSLADLAPLYCELVVIFCD